MTSFDELFTNLGERTFFWNDPSSGLRAILVIDDVTLGPAAGGVRTMTYPSLDAAVRDARILAEAMTIKTSLAGLDAGGGKIVIACGKEIDRPQAFYRLGEFVEELGGLFRTAGDLGTTSADLQTMALTCRYVHTDEGNLADAVARGVLMSIGACVAAKHDRAFSSAPDALDLDGVHVAVQGCGSIGTTVARILASHGARISLSDRVRSRADELASKLAVELGKDSRVNAVENREILALDADILCPCGAGGVIDAKTAATIRSWAICGAANNILTDANAEQTLHDRGVLVVPDVVASAGAVIEGIGRTVMQLDNRAKLIDALGSTAWDILRQSREQHLPTSEVARRRARERIEQAKQTRQNG